MNQWDLLRQLCPKLFKQGICICCGLGWYALLHNLCLEIERILERDAEKYKAIEGEENEFIEMYAVQIKEKYGTLRFYMSCETDEIDDLIRKAESLSREICEKCGSPGSMRDTSWYAVKCDACFNEYNKGRENHERSC